MMLSWSLVGLFASKPLQTWSFYHLTSGFKFHTHYDFNQPFCGGSAMNYMNYLKKNNKHIELICKNDAYGFNWFI